MYCLDTNVCIDAMKAVNPHLMRAFQSRLPDEIHVPSMVRAELLYGAKRSAHPERNRMLVENFIAPFKVLAFDSIGADEYAMIRIDLERSGQRIGPNDLVIAATALAHRLVLVTRNTREFARVQGLRIENWSA